MFGVHGGMSPNVSTSLAAFMAVTTDSRVMLSGSPKFSMIVLKWYTATHERNGLLLIWSFCSSFLPEAERSLITVGRIGQRAGSPVIGGSSALK